MDGAEASSTARSLALGSFPSGPPCGSSLLQACWAAWNVEEEGSRVLLGPPLIAIPTLPSPVVWGSGKSVMPWSRMHCEKASADLYGSGDGLGFGAAAAGPRPGPGPSACAPRGP